MTSTPPPIDKTAIRDAATVIVVRDRATDPAVLMGQRGSKAAFMPNKFVFPGGAVDPGDATIPLAQPIPAPCRHRLSDEATTGLAPALTAAAIRELWEETGLVLGRPGALGRSDPPRLAGVCTNRSRAMCRGTAIRVSRNHAAGAATPV